MKFNSQICTTRSQSEALLKLGLKKETADCYTPIKLNPDKGSLPCPPDFWTSDEPFIKKIREASIPAWCLHRLIELKQPNMIDNAIVVLSREQTYDKLIGMIAKSIKEGYFPKEYLV